MTLTPKEAMRLSHADALLQKHSNGLVHYPNNERGPEYEVTVEQAADIIDEANATKDATITRLRAELQQSYKDAQREARDAYSEGQERGATRNAPGW